VVDALKLLGAKKLSVITPYEEWNNQRLKPYMEAMGFEVLNVDGHPTPASGAVAICDHDPEEIVEFGVKMCRPEADALLCSCTDWRSLEIVEQLEKLTGKTVITSNQATIWDVSRKLGVQGPIHGFGSLLEGLAMAPSL
ncbi:MAG: Asp/Glu racemase, partial [Dehalococcoidia bacterium]